MRFYTNSKNKRLHIIVKKANEVLNSDAFQSEIVNYGKFKPQFTSPEVDGLYVLSRLIGDPSLIEVCEFRSLNPFTSSNGYTKDNGQLKIFLNNRKFFRSDASIVGTVLHEAVHKADSNDSKYFYNHGDNTPKGGTAPEVVADIAYKVESGFESTESSAL